MVRTSLFTTADEVRAPGQILIRSHNSEWAALEVEVNALLIDPDISPEVLEMLREMGL